MKVYKVYGYNYIKTSNSMKQINFFNIKCFIYNK
jgi:hypothetical protein